MSNKTIRNLLFTAGMVILSLYFVLGAISLVLTQRDNFGKKQIMAGYDWAYAEIYNQSGDWCASPEAYDESAFTLIINFGYDESMTITSTSDGTTKISLEPSILMEAKSLQEMFNGFQLMEGQILDVVLEDGSHFQVFVCGRKIYLIGPAFG
jgi:hypothetical protein